MASATVGNLRVTLSADSAQFAKGMKSAEGRLGKFGMAAKAGVAGLAAIGVAAAAAAASVVAGVRRTIAEADKMAKAAQAIGIPAEELQKLKHAADLSGVSFESLQTSVTRLSRAMSEAARGGGADAARAFEQLGIAVTNADGTLRTSSEVMSDVADRFSNMDDGAQKTALAMAIFGRAGASMIPMLNQGKEALEASKREAEQFGVVMSGPLQKASERFNDNMSRMGTWLRGIFVQIAERVVPALADLTDKIVTWAKESDTAHRIGRFLDEMFRLIAQGAAYANKAISDVSAATIFLGNASREALGYLSGNGDLNKIPQFWQQMQEQVSESSRKLAEDLDRIRNPGAREVTIPGNTGPRPGDAGTGGGGGGGGGSVDNSLEIERQRILARLETIRQGHLTEQEQMMEALLEKQNTIDEAYQKELISAEQHNEMMRKVEEDHQNRIRTIRDAANNNLLTSTGRVLGAVGNVIRSGGEKNLKVVQGLGIAQALINAWVGASEALKLPFPANLGAFATVLATGLNAVANIRRVSSSGGGGGSSGAISTPSMDGAGATGTGGNSVYVTLQGSSFNRDQVRDLLGQINEYVADGGQVVLA